MPSLEILLTFLATTAIFAFIPGPAILYAAARTLAGGRWSGLMASLGIHLGGYVHVVAAAAGLSLIFHAVPVLYMAVKLFGAAYLVWLGISLFRSKAQEDVSLSHVGLKSGRRAFAESVSVEVLNPKARSSISPSCPSSSTPRHPSRCGFSSFSSGQWSTSCSPLRI